MVPELNKHHCLYSTSMWMFHVQPNAMYEASIRVGWGTRWQRKLWVQVQCINQKTTFLQSMALLNYRPKRQCHVTLFTSCKLVTSGVSLLGTDQICCLEGSLVSGFDHSCVSRHSVECPFLILSLFCRKDLRGFEDCAGSLD